MTEAITSYAGSLVVVGSNSLLRGRCADASPAQTIFPSAIQAIAWMLPPHHTSFFINLWHTNRFIFASAILVHGNLFRIRLQCHRRSVNSLCPH